MTSPVRATVFAAARQSAVRSTSPARSPKPRDARSSASSAPTSKRSCGAAPATCRAGRVRPISRGTTCAIFSESAASTATAVTPAVAPEVALGGGPASIHRRVADAVGTSDAVAAVSARRASLAVLGTAEWTAVVGRCTRVVSWNAAIGVAGRRHDSAGSLQGSDRRQAGVAAAAVGRHRARVTLGYASATAVGCRHETSQSTGRVGDARAIRCSSLR